MSEKDVREIVKGKVIRGMDIGLDTITFYFEDGSRLEVEAAHGYSDEPGYYGSDPFPEIHAKFKGA